MHTLRARPRAHYLLIAALLRGRSRRVREFGRPRQLAGVAVAEGVAGHQVTGGSGGAKNWTLQCDPAGGSHPNPASACQVLLRAKNPFAPVPKGMMCPMILAGTRVAKVTGVYFGQHVNTTFTQGGCNLPRWAKIGQIFN